MPLLSDGEKRIVGKEEIVHNKCILIFRKCFRNYNTYPSILASMRDGVKINLYILYSKHDIADASS